MGPYLLLLPATAVIGALILWPAVQVGLFSFQDYGLMQISGVLPAQWIGFSNYSQILHDPEFWQSLKTSVYFALVVVPLTLIAGTLVGLLLVRLGPKMRTFVSVSALLAWATPAVSASVIFVWLVDPDGGVVDWALAKLPSWLGGGAHWAGLLLDERHAARLHRADRDAGLDRLPVHRGHRARRAAHAAVRAARGGAGGRRGCRGGPSGR